jgi:hypothetical protein
MRLRICRIAVAAVLVAGCSSGDGDAIKTPNQHSSSAAAASQVTGDAPVVLEATVDTASSGCDTKVKGDCWLPLYIDMTTTEDPLNLTGSCTRDKQATCWPQPGDTVMVNCLGTSDGLLWYGVTMPIDKVRGKGLTEYTKVTGHNKVQWLRIKGKASQLEECKPA